MYRSLAAAVLVLSTSLLAPNTAVGAPVLHTLTFSAQSILDTPFGLTSVPAPISSQFVVDGSIFEPGGPEIVDALPGFSLTAPIVIGDAVFTNADVQGTPGGRVVGGNLVEIFLLAQFIDPVEGQRELRTYFFPPFQWDGTDFNPGNSSSEFVFGTYSISVAEPIPEPLSLSLLALGLGCIGVRRWRTGKPF